LYHFFSLRFYFYLVEREKERAQVGRAAEGGEADSQLSGEPDVGHHPRTQRSWFMT